MGSFTDPGGMDISGAGRERMTSRAGRWATEQVGIRGRIAAEAADELGCG